MELNIPYDYVPEITLVSAMDGTIKKKKILKMKIIFLYKNNICSFDCKQTGKKIIRDFKRYDNIDELWNFMDERIQSYDEINSQKLTLQYLISKTSQNVYKTLENYDLNTDCESNFKNAFERMKKISK